MTDEIFPATITVDESYDLDSKENTVRTQRVKDAYGISFEVGELSVIDDVTIDLERGDILFATGASGAGKTTLCRAIAEELDAVSFENVDVPREVPLVDVFPEEFDVEETQRYMGLFGLTDAHLNLRTYEELSQGQRYRAKLAYTASRYDVVFADEFAATLDRETAKTISYSIRRATLKGRLPTTFILASTHRDIIDDLRANVLVDFDRNSVKELENDSHLVEGNTPLEVVIDDDGLDPDTREDVREAIRDGERYELDLVDVDEVVTPLSRLANERTSTPAYESRSRINSNSPRAPSRTGRTFIGGITSGTR